MERNVRRAKRNETIVLGVLTAFFAVLTVRIVLGSPDRFPGHLGYGPGAAIGVVSEQAATAAFLREATPAFGPGVAIRYYGAEQGANEALIRVEDPRQPLITASPIGVPASQVATTNFQGSTYDCGRLPTTPDWIPWQASVSACSWTSEGRGWILVSSGPDLVSDADRTSFVRGTTSIIAIVILALITAGLGTATYKVARRRI
jgi:hypothetical protein